MYRIAIPVMIMTLPSTRRVLEPGATFLIEGKPELPSWLPSASRRCAALSLSAIVCSSMR